MFGMLFDVTRCKGCERCVDACVEANGLDPVAAAQDRATTRDGLSANRPLSVMPVGDGRFARMSCMHCVEPSCVSACLVGAIRKTLEGPVVYDPDMCIGCRYCMLACPFHVPRYEWDETRPLMRKCDMCAERQREGLVPACVAACPSGALAFDSREALIAEAHRRIEADPDEYYPHVFGENEVGGTSVLFLVPFPVASLGFKEGLGASLGIHPAGVGHHPDPLLHHCRPHLKLDKLILVDAFSQ